MLNTCLRPCLDVFWFSVSEIWPPFAVCEFLVAVLSNYAVPDLDQFQRYSQLKGHGKNPQIIFRALLCLQQSSSLGVLSRAQFFKDSQELVTIGSLYKRKVIKLSWIRMKEIPKRIFAIHFEVVYATPHFLFLFLIWCSFFNAGQNVSVKFLHGALATILNSSTDIALVRCCHMVQAWANLCHLNDKFLS